MLSCCGSNCTDIAHWLISSTSLFDWTPGEYKYYIINLIVTTPYCCHLNLRTYQFTNYKKIFRGATTIYTSFLVYPVVSLYKAKTIDNCPSPPPNNHSNGNQNIFVQLKKAIIELCELKICIKYSFNKEEWSYTSKWDPTVKFSNQTKIWEFQVYIFETIVHIIQNNLITHKQIQKFSSRLKTTHFHNTFWRNTNIHKVKIF